jgi:hypothetical protein
MLFNSKTLVSLIALLIQPVEAQLPRKRRSLETREECKWNENYIALSKEECRRTQKKHTNLPWRENFTDGSTENSKYNGCVKVTGRGKRGTFRWVSELIVINADLGKLNKLNQFKGLISGDKYTIKSACKGDSGELELHLLKKANV